MPRFREITKPCWPLKDTWHQPLVQVATSIDVPFGISARILPDVVGVSRKLTSDVTVVGFAFAPATVSISPAAADRIARASVIVRPLDHNNRSAGTIMARLARQ